MKLRKLNDREKSEMRDEVAMHLYGHLLGNGLSADFNAHKAFEAAERFLTAREKEDYNEVVEMKCEDCEKRKADIAPIPRAEIIRANKPKGWVLILVVFVCILGIIYLFSLLGQLLTWLLH